MWRYLAGAKKPEQKKSENKEYFKQYEASKRKRSFVPSWKINRPWLEDSSDGMICAACKSTSSVNMFTEGCKSYKLDSIVKHENSDSHKYANASWKAKSEPKEKSQASQLLLQLNKEVASRLHILFKNVHAIIINNRPLSDYEWLCKLDHSKGVDIGKTYNTRHACKDFMASIAAAEMSKISKLLAQSKFVSIIGDGSVDGSVTEQEIWFVRFCLQGQIYVKFVGVEALEKANAESILSSIRHAFTSNLNISWDQISSKVVGLSCDGAAVMLGQRAGVGALLKRELPEVITIHCMAHRLELSLKDSAKSVKLFDKVVNVLALGLYLFYHNSALNRSMLKRTGQALQDGKNPLLPTRVGGTRWVQHTIRALNNITKSYEIICTHLGQLTESTERVSVDAQSKAKAFLKLLKSRSIMLFVYFLIDVLNPLEKLSKVFQQEDSVVASAHSCFGTTLEVIEQLRERDGPNLNKFKESLPSELVGSEDEFNNERQKFIENILSAMRKRYSEFSSPSVIFATRFADLPTYPSSWSTLKGSFPLFFINSVLGLFIGFFLFYDYQLEFGNDDIQTLVQHFGNTLTSNDINTSCIQEEWTCVKKWLFDGNYLSKRPVVITWKDVNEMCPGNGNIFNLIDLVLSLSPSSAEAERGFSKLKLTKTILRSSLNQETLNNCLTIKYLCAPICTFDPTCAVEHWVSNSKAARRPFTKDQMNKEAATIYIDCEVEDDNYSDDDSSSASDADELHLTTEENILEDI